MKNSWPTFSRFMLAIVFSLISCTLRAVAPLIPAPPAVAAKAYLLMDYQSGKLLAASNEHAHLEPASLTKMMTVYVVYKELAQGKLSLADKVRISEKAWRTEGSRMFAEVGKEISVGELLQGVIIQSGNDASVALAEHVAGSEESFAEMMNAYAKRLGMNDSHFTDATGMPNPNHYTSAYDLALLAQATIREFPPELYALHAEKWFSFNGIKQPNRNRLLWRNPAVDGLKTGFTESAGYCLVASAKKDNTRLISVVLGTDSDIARAEQSHKLLTYGLRFYETHTLFAANQPLNEARVWMGRAKTLPIGLPNGLYVTIPHGQYKNLSASLNVDKRIKAPVAKGQILGSVVVHLNDQVLLTQPLIALETVETGGTFSRAKDYVSMRSSQLFHPKSE